MASLPASGCLLLLAAATLLCCQAQEANHWYPKPCKPYPLNKKYYAKKFHPGKHWCPPNRPSPSPTPAPSPAPSACPSGKVPVSYVNMLRSNDSLPALKGGATNTFGGMKDKDKLDVWHVLPSVAGVAYAAAPADAGGYTLPATSGYAKFKQYGNAPDIPTLHQRGKDIYMVNHWEYGQPGSLYITKLAQDSSSGKLTPTATEWINDKIGTWFPCSGTVTPWSTHLGSEEYPADCRIYETTLDSNTCTANTDFTACGWVTKNAFEAGSALGMSRMFGGQSMHPISGEDYVDISNPAIVNFEKALGFGNQAKINTFNNLFNCYAYGWTPEVAVANDGSYKYTKWLTLGRVAHESAIVLPDLKTVYTTDDGTNCGFFMLKTDKPADLSSGKLYAAKLKENGAADKWTVSWIYLGSATQSQLQVMVNKKLKFSDIFETAAPVKDTPNFCPAGFKATNTATTTYLWPETPAPGDPAQAFIECLKVKPGMETAAAFLETRRYAAMLGATTEFEKEEGITYNPKANELYVAYTKISSGMSNNTKYTAGQKGDVNMPENRCGAIFSYQLDKDYQATGAQAILYGTPMDADADLNKCTLDGISNPDNIHYINGLLLIAEDTSDHLNNVLWAYDMESKTLTRILSSPRLAEVSGIYISYAGDYAYLALAMQHPEEDTPASAITLDKALMQRGYVGYIGPLNAACLQAGKKPVFEGINAAKTPEEKSAVLYTKSVQYV